MKHKFMPRFLAFLMVCLTSLFCIGCFGLGDDNKSKKIEIVGTPKMTVEYTTYLGYSCEISGTLKNNTSRDYDYVSVEFSVYDANGNVIGTALDNINNIGPGESWSFNATLFDFPETKPTSYKLKEITSW